jgi:hypothetical protein
LDRRGWWGCGLVVLGFLLCVHGGFHLVTDGSVRNVSVEKLKMVGHGIIGDFVHFNL